MKEIHISGAGPAGLSAAIELAKSGVKTIVHEKKATIGGNFKTTIHSVKNYKNYFETDFLFYSKNVLGLNIKESVFPVSSFKRYLPNGENYSVYNNGEPIVYNVKRGIDPNSIDSLMYNQALNLGVEFDFQTKFPISKSQIIATGTRYADFQGYGFHLSKISIDLLDEVKVFFNEEYAPRGYAYIVPFGDGSATISVFATTKYMKTHIKAYFEKFYNYITSTKIIEGGQIESEDHGVGFYNLYSSYIHNQQVYVGTAAGLMTADYGFALSNCLISGNAAAKHFTQNLNYDKFIKHYIFDELSKSYIKRLRLNKIEENYELTKLLNKNLTKYKKTNFIVINIYKRSRILTLVAYILAYKRRKRYKLVKNV